MTASTGSQAGSLFPAITILYWLATAGRRIRLVTTVPVIGITGGQKRGWLVVAKQYLTGASARSGSQAGGGVAWLAISAARSTFSAISAVPAADSGDSSPASCGRLLNVAGNQCCGNMASAYYAWPINICLVITDDLVSL